MQEKVGTQEKEPGLKDHTMAFRACFVFDRGL